MSRKKDYIFVTIIGFCVGGLALLPFYNINIEITFPTIILSVIGFTVLGPLAFFILEYFSRWLKMLHQIAKFAATGTLSSLIKLAVVNAFILYTGIINGFYFSVFITVAFFIAQTNSYLWNKFWTFQSTTKMSFKEYSRFFLFTLVGWAIAVGIAAFLVDIVGPPWNLDPTIWANIATIASILGAATWNFISYRLIVFKAEVHSAV